MRVERRLAPIVGVFVIFLVFGLMLTSLAATLTDARFIELGLALCVVVGVSTRRLFKGAQPPPSFRRREYRPGWIQRTGRP